MVRHPLIAALAVVVVAIVILIATSALEPAAPVRPTEAVGTSPAALTTPAAPNAAIPVGGTELYGYLPYWEMSASMAAYLSGVPLTTIGLFSVTAGANGALQHGTIGYRRIAGPIGQQLIGQAHARGQRVELVFSSFGFTKNERLFASPLPDDAAVPRGPTSMRAMSPPAWLATATQLSDLAVGLRVDGINADVEDIPSDVYEGYAAFLSTLRSRLDQAIVGASLSAATRLSPDGAALAGAAVAGGADRIFLMGYGYHWSRSGPGASAPLDEIDGRPDLRTSIAAYAAAGVPPERIILGLPLFGMSWPVVSADRDAPSIGTGVTWIPSAHRSVLTAPGFVSNPDWLQATEFFATANATTAVPGWRATFYDSPRTLLPKLQLARASGFAGAGFWAIGYERGLPGYLELMRDFRRGDILPAEPIEVGER